MYETKDKKSAIREIQIFLEYLSEDTVYIAPSGVYDEPTRLAVIDFQRKNGLTESGVVDMTTHTAIYDRYIEKRREREAIKLSSGLIDFPLSVGNRNDKMIEVNKTLSVLSEYYRLEPYMNSGRFFTVETAKTVKALRRIYLMVDGESIDELFYLRMMQDYDSIIKAEGTFFEYNE